jgi:penicillin V acylase-like amidase (Ntn superfamily)
MLMKIKEAHQPKDSCTSFCLDNDGFAVFGANYDHGKIHEGLVFTNKRNIPKSYWEDDPVSGHARWTSKYGSVTFNLVMAQFAWGGMNEAGLVISTMELPCSRSPAPDKRPWIYANYWVQYLLDNCSTAEEVIATSSSIRVKGYVDHYLVCDRKGHCTAIEFLEGKTIYHTGDALPVKALTNTAYEYSIAAWETYRKQKLQGEIAPIRDPSLRRFVLAADSVQGFKPTDSESAVEYAFDVLAEASGQKVGGSPTRWSIVFDTENLTIAFHTSTHPDIRYINLHALDFSRNTPVRMLDIHEKLSSDVTNKMRDYFSAFHLGHALRAGRQWGTDADTIEKEIRYMESFLCEEQGAG